MAQDALSAQAAPKSKFSFKRSATALRTATPAPPVPAPAPPPSSNSSPSVSTTSAVPPTPLTIASRSDSYLSIADLPACSPSSAEALALTSLSRCYVNLAADSHSSTTSDRFSALYLSDIVDSVVVLPVIGGGSAMLQNCRRCVLVLGGHQVRPLPAPTCDGRAELRVQTVSHARLDGLPCPLGGRQHPHHRAMQRTCLRLLSSLVPGVYRLRNSNAVPLIFRYSQHSSSSAPSAAADDFAVQDFDDPFATPERPSSNWRRATQAEGTAVEPFFRSERKRWEQARDDALRIVDGLNGTVTR